MNNTAADRSCTCWAFNTSEKLYLIIKTDMPLKVRLSDHNLLTCQSSGLSALSALLEGTEQRQTLFGFHSIDGSSACCVRPQGFHQDSASRRSQRFTKSSAPRRPTAALIKALGGQSSCVSCSTHTLHCAYSHTYSHFCWPLGRQWHAANKEQSVCVCVCVWKRHEGSEVI